MAVNATTNIQLNETPVTDDVNPFPSADGEFALYKFTYHCQYGITIISSLAVLTLNSNKTTIITRTGNIRRLQTAGRNKMRSGADRHWSVLITWQIRMGSRSEVLLRRAKIPGSEKSWYLSLFGVELPNLVQWHNVAGGGHRVWISLSNNFAHPVSKVCALTSDLLVLSAFSVLQVSFRLTVEVRSHADGQRHNASSGQSPFCITAADSLCWLCGYNYDSTAIRLLIKGH